MSSPAHSDHAPAHSDRVYSSYFNDLQQKAKDERYRQKLDMIGPEMSDLYATMPRCSEASCNQWSTSSSYINFVVWAPNEFLVLRVDLDNDFIPKAFQEATTFFTAGILPELVGNWYTKAPVYSRASDNRCQDQRFSSCHC